MRIYQHVFINDWATYRGVDDSLKITSRMRGIVFAFYIPVFVAAFAAFSTAAMLLTQYQRMEIFSSKTSNRLIALGISLICVSLVDTLILSFEGPLLTHWNVDGPISPQYYYDSGDITIALAGAGFCLVGWITREALLIQKENEAII
ncbi:MAG: DUF2975 domain-containing protein [Pseudomonadota bacterium]